MASSELPGELRDLIVRVAAHPHGLGFLHQAWLESVAVTLGVHPFVVEAAREYLETPEGRALLIEEVRIERERLRAFPAAMAGSSRAIPPEPPQIDGIDDLLAASERHPLGRGFLLNGPLETVAVTLGVHPFLVIRARGALRRRRATRPAAGAPDPGATAGPGAPPDSAPAD